MSEAQITLPAAASSVPTARHFTESILAGWGLTDLAWSATLIVSELAANAALHARGEDFSIRIQVEADGVLLEVQDGSQQVPRQRSYSESATTGRGLRLVAELAAEWGVTPTGDGKSVWALLPSPDDTDSAEKDTDLDTLLSAFDDGDVVVPIGDAGGGASGVVGVQAVAA